MVFCLTIEQTVFGQSSEVCPDKSIFTPCICYTQYGEITYKELECVGETVTDLDAMVDKMDKYMNDNQKYFYSLRLDRTGITSLKENQFPKMSLQSIRIINNKNLTTINENAFKSTEGSISMVTIKDNPVLTFGDPSVFDFLAKFARLTYLTLGSAGFNSIPTNLLGNNKLSKLHFVGEALKTIEVNAFSKQTDLFGIDFNRTSIESFPEKAFYFENVSQYELTLEFEDNPHINGSNFPTNSLMNSNRAIELKLGGNDNSWSYLDENLFKPLLSKSPSINIVINSIDCNDDRNSWLKNEPEIDKIKIYNSTTRKSTTLAC